MRVSIAIGAVVVEVEAEGSYAPDITADLCARALHLIREVTTPEQVAAAEAESDE